MANTMVICCFQIDDRRSSSGSRLETSGGVVESENFYCSIVPVSRDFRHQDFELPYADRLPSISLVSDCMERQDVPASVPYPVGSLIAGRNLAAVYVGFVKGLARGMV
jgi:hypothetical protein